MTGPKIRSFAFGGLLVALMLFVPQARTAFSQGSPSTLQTEQVIIQNTDDIREKAEDLIRNINKNSSIPLLGPGSNKTEELRQLRSIRSPLSKRLYELKGFAENVKNSRVALIEQLQRKVPTDEEKRAKLEALSSDLEDAQFDKKNADNGRNVFLAKQQEDKNDLIILQNKDPRTSDEDRELKALSSKVKEYDRNSETDRSYYENELKKIARRTAAIQSKITYINNGSAMKADDVVELKRKIEETDSVLKRAQNTIRLSDDTLANLDETAGLLLQTDLMSLSYSDRSTWVFGLLVGGVIFGFFVIAARSERVRDVIFTGDSGIQFITLFSLVIAIILFGILRILEGKELAALLGGLSGYILGKSTHAGLGRSDAAKG